MDVKKKKETKKGKKAVTRGTGVSKVIRFDNGLSVTA